MSFTIKHGLFKYDLSDHHAVLGIPINSDSKQVRKQYLKIARSLHPDMVKGKSDEEKKQANEILSKLVNPAYEQLSKSSSQSEYELVLKQTGKRLAGDGKIALDSDGAKQLAKAPSGSLDAAYQTAVKQLASAQYKDLGNIIATVGQLSELNMVYLLRKQGKVSGGKTPAAAGAAKAGSAAGQKPGAAGAATPPPPVEKTSPVDHYIQRAQEHISKKNFAKAVLDLRDAIKLEPDNSTSHALLGMTYLRQNQATMAKVHITKAIASNSQDPLVVQAKQALERVTGQKLEPKAAASGGKKDNRDEKKGGLFGMFGGAKKK
ncbi:MAG: J domain-containing protein [Cyanobacteriota bacterium]|nr:J domain-containing protein [Cyanobacteriota bacterium]